MLTLDSLDDSLIERKQKEIKELKKEINKLHGELSKSEHARKEWNDKYHQMCKRNNELTLKNLELSDKLLHYEHESLRLDIGEDSIDILYWNNNKEEYDIFATFYENELEPALQDYCEEFLIELKDIYMIK